MRELCESYVPSRRLESDITARKGRRKWSTVALHRCSNRFSVQQGLERDSSECYLVIIHGSDLSFEPFLFFFRSKRFDGHFSEVEIALWNKIDNFQVTRSFFKLADSFKTISIVLNMITERALISCVLFVKFLRSSCGALHSVLKPNKQLSSCLFTFKIYC